MWKFHKRNLRLLSHFYFYTQRWTKFYWLLIVLCCKTFSTHSCCLLQNLDGDGRDFYAPRKEKKKIIKTMNIFLKFIKKIFESKFTLFPHKPHPPFFIAYILLAILFSSTFSSYLNENQQKWSKQKNVYEKLFSCSKRSIPSFFRFQIKKLLSSYFLHRSLCKSKKTSKKFLLSLREIFSASAPRG